MPIVFEDDYQSIFETIPFVLFIHKFSPISCYLTEKQEGNEKVFETRAKNFLQINTVHVCACMSKMHMY